MAGTGGVSPSAMPTLPPQAAVGSGAPSCADLVAALDWSRTTLGPRDRWDPAVRATVDLLLASALPMALTHGDDFVLIYNDAYADLIGSLHPAAVGRPANEVFAEFWSAPGIGAVLEEVYRTGEPFLEAESQLTVSRGSAGRPEQAFFTRGHSAVRDMRGDVAGVLTVAAETTQVTRRLQSLGELTARLAGALTIDDVARVVLTYATASFDVDHCVFAVDDGGAFRFVRRIRGEMLDEADERLPPLWRRLPADHESPLTAAGETGRPSFVADGEPLRRVAT